MGGCPNTGRFVIIVFRTAFELRGIADALLMPRSTLTYLPVTRTFQKVFRHRPEFLQTSHNKTKPSLFSFPSIASAPRLYHYSLTFSHCPVRTIMVPPMAARLVTTWPPPPTRPVRRHRNELSSLRRTLFRERGAPSLTRDLFAECSAGKRRAKPVACPPSPSW